jgi:curved DNA-binding protein CbpA
MSSMHTAAVDDPYDTLGVGRNASPTEIRRAWHEKIKAFHPDKGGDRETFEKVMAAYGILGDPNRRIEWDKYGKSEKPPEGVEDNLAYTRIVELILQGMTQVNNPLRTNWIDYVKRRCGEQATELITKSKAARKAAETHHRMAAGFKRKGEGTNRLEAAFLDLAKAAEQQAEYYGKQMDELERVLKFLADYEFKMEEDSYRPYGLNPFQNVMTPYGGYT